VNKFTKRIINIIALSMAVIPLISISAVAYAAGNTPLVTDPNYHSSIDISGNNISYVDVINGQSQVYVYNFVSGKTKQITHDINTSDSANLSRIFNNYLVYPDSRTGYAQIYLYDLNTKTEKAITTTPGYRSFPDIWGTKVVWQDNSIPANGNDIFMYDINTQVTTQLTNDTADEYNPSVGSKWISWTKGNGSTAAIYAYNISTGQTQLVVSEPGADNSRVSGNTITWNDQRRGTSFSDVYMMNLKNSIEQLVSDGVDYDGRPAVSGQNIVYVDFSSTQGDIKEYNILTKQTLFITKNQYTQSQPSIDGQNIIWVDYRNGPPEIYGKVT
jgi:beta propeller repeat protein